MMEEQVAAALAADAGVSAIVGSRIYAMPAPEGAASPFVTWQVVDVDRIGETYDGRSAFDVTLLQIDCWADRTTDTSSSSRTAQVLALARAVRAALDRKGLTGEDTVDIIRWRRWHDQSTPEEVRRVLEFSLLVKDP